MKKKVPRSYRLLLFVYPRRFRLTYGSEAIRQLQSDLREARRAGPMKAALGHVIGMADFIFAGLSERIASHKAKVKPKSVLAFALDRGVGSGKCPSLHPTHASLR